MRTMSGNRAARPQLEVLESRLALNAPPPVAAPVLPAVVQPQQVRTLVPPEMLGGRPAEQPVRFQTPSGGPHREALPVVIADMVLGLEEEEVNPEVIE